MARRRRQTRTKQHASERLSSHSSMLLFVNIVDTAGFFSCSVRGGHAECSRLLAAGRMCRGRHRGPSGVVPLRSPAAALSVLVRRRLSSALPSFLLASRPEHTRTARISQAMTSKKKDAASAKQTASTAAAANGTNLAAPAEARGHASPGASAISVDIAGENSAQRVSMR